jgi:hypothetical protein
MAVFTAIATAIVGALGVTGATIFGSALLYSTVVGVVAAGLGLVTAKLLGVFDVPGAGPDPGTKIQVAPSTDNKIGVAYGRNFMSGPITDVAISNSNDTMHYCITLSELADGHDVGTYTTNQIFFGDRKLNFSGANVISYSDPNATTTEDWANKIRIRVYAGGTAASNQIFPTSGAVAATTMMPHWTTTTAYSMEKLVFAMIELDYDAENGLTGLGAMTFDVTNSKHNPGEVLFDYLKSTRYGAGLANADIDITSILGTANTQMKGYCDEQITYTPNTGGSSTIDRYQINGYLSTYKSCMDNIDSICRNSATYFTFDGKQGKFSAVPNRAYLTSELTNAFVLNDDNIISKISITSTELYNTLNSVTVTFADQNRKDQTNSIQIETPGVDRNTGEPDNDFEYRAELVNNNIHARQLANIDLNQSREGMVVNLVGDYSCLQIDAGDVVKLNNTDYGFTDKLFRVMKNKELFGEDGMITCELLLLEYDADAYIVATVVESDDEDAGTGIITVPPVGDLLPPSAYAHYFPGVTQKSTTGSGTGAKFDVLKDFANVTYYIPAVSGGNPTANGGSGYAAGDNVVISGNQLAGIDGIHDCTFTISNAPAGKFNSANAVSGIAFVIGGAGSRRNIPGEQMADLAVGTQVTENPARVTNMTASGTFTSIGADIDVDLTEVDDGEYTLSTNFTPVGSFASISTANFGVGVQGDVTFADGSITTDYFDARNRFDNQQDMPTVVNTSGNFTITPDMDSVTLRPVGFNTADQTAGTNERGYENMKIDLIKLRGADIF